MWFISIYNTISNIALDKIKNFLFQELCVADIEMCHGDYSMLCKTKKHGWYGCWKGLPPSSFRSWRGLKRSDNAQWNRNSRNFQNSGKKDNLWRLSTNFEMSFQKCSVPFDFVPEFPEILVQWIAPLIMSPFWKVLVSLSQFHKTLGCRCRNYIE